MTGLRVITSVIRTRDAHEWAREPFGHYVEPEWCSIRLFAIEPL
jgi:hypothetical protein